MSKRKVADMKPIYLKRAYEDPALQDGFRVLVDRLWPRGTTKEKLKIDVWARDLAPSTPLRKWFSHESGKWESFKHRYFTELDEHPDEVAQLLEKITESTLTLVYSARDEQFNNAAALKEYLENKLGIK